MADAVLVIGANTKQVQAALKKAGKSIDKVGKKVKKQGKTLGDLKASWIAIAAVTVGVVRGFAATIQAASDLEEETNKFNVVFRTTIKEATKMRDALVDAYGMSRIEATRSLAAIQDFLVPMGIARESATELSSSFNKLAVDIGSFNNQPTAIVMEAIKSALAGMSRPMRQFGVDVSETALKQMALNQGIALVNGKLDSQSRAMLILQKIHIDSADAVGDFSRSQESLANQQKILKAGFEDIKTSIGTFFLPAITDAINVINKLIKTQKGMTDTLMSGLADATYRKSIEKGNKKLNERKWTLKELLKASTALNNFLANNEPKILEATENHNTKLLKQIAIYQGQAKAIDELIGKFKARQLAEEEALQANMDMVDLYIEKTIEKQKTELELEIKKVSELLNLDGILIIQKEKLNKRLIELNTKLNDSITKDWEKTAKGIQAGTDALFGFLESNLQDQKITWELVWKSIGAGMVEAIGTAISNQLAIMAVAEWAKVFVPPPVGGPQHIPGAVALTAASTGVRILAKTLSHEIMSLAGGGDFITEGPQLLIVGDNPTGHERVTVTPEEQGMGGGIAIENMTVVANNPEEFGDQMFAFAESTGSQASRR